MSEVFVSSFALLFVMIDPIGLTPMFAALTVGMPRAKRISVAARSVMVAGLILLIFGLAGDAILTAIGVSLPAFRVAGGLMLLLIAIEMLFQKRAERREKNTDADPHDDPSVFPLATPLTAGPGAMATMILLTAEHSGTLAEHVMVYGAAACVLAICFATFISTEFVEKILQPTGIMVLSRLFGMLLGALAVQFIFDGLMALLDRSI